MENSFRIKELSNEPFFTSGKFIGDENAEIREVIGIREAAGKNLPHCISWINEKNLQLISQPLQLGLLILNPAGYETLKNHSCNFLVVENPRLIFQKILKARFSSRRQAGIEKTAQVHPDAVVGPDSYIGHHVVIEAGCRIGTGCEILHNTVILKNTIVGDRVRIGCNCTLGNFGFGYEKNESGDYELLEHTGHVEIGNDVHIHNNSCIDRAVIGKTIIGDQVKIDNLVHIAHGVHIGENSLIIANAMIAGSVTIGDNCWIAPSVSVKNQLTIAPKTMTGIGAVVLKNTEADSVVIGNPAITMEEYRKWSAAKNKLMQDQ